MCVCVRPIYFGDSPSVQGETCATRCCVSRGLSVVQCISCPTRTTEVTQEGVDTQGLFSSFRISFLPHRPPAVLAFICYREKGSAIPIPRQQQSRTWSMKLFGCTVNRFPLVSYESEKKPTLAEIRTRDLVARSYGDTN